MAKVVITGAQGFVGQHLVKELAAHGYQVISWDLPAVDITNPATFRRPLQELKPAWIVHLAAVSAVPAAAQNPARARAVNVDGTRRLLETLTEVSPATKVLAVSSADVYNQPRNMYAQTKFEMEQLIAEHFAERVIVVRPFPHIGPGQGLGFVTADFASQIAAIESGQQPPVIQVGNLEAKRDFTDVRDVVKAYRLLLQKGSVGAVYEVASGNVVSIQTILDHLLALSSVSITVAPDPARLRSTTAPMPAADTAPIKALGWQPQMPLDQSLQDILTWWRQKTV